MKFSPNLVAIVLPLLLIGACASSSQSIDLANNDLLYTDVPFTTKAPGDREVFIAPVDDGRAGTVLPVQERGFPISYGSDDFWERPVQEMIGDVLVRQIANSGLFTKVTDRVEPQALLVKPVLVAFTTGATEAISGSRSFAEVGLRVQVLGPADGNGERAVLLEQTYGNRQVSTLEVNPVSPYRLVGRALQLSMQKLLAGLDGSSIGRSDVPMQPIGTPASPAR